MLPQSAITYFQHLIDDDIEHCAGQVSEWEQDLDNRQPDWRRVSLAESLSRLFRQDFARWHGLILSRIESVHKRFGLPLSNEAEEQLLDAGLSSLSKRFTTLERDYLRRVQQLSAAVPPSHLSDDLHKSRNDLTAGVRRYFWTLRHVPPEPIGPVRTRGPDKLVFNGPVGAVQTGAGAVAHVQQQWSQTGAAELTQALSALRLAIANAQSQLGAAVAAESVQDVDKASAELAKAEPNRMLILKWLAGLGAVVQTVASAKPAYEAVAEIARALGIPLP